jgi:glycosyltransferase involved in cell wall biosynthesis
LKILLELRPALDGHAGIPQETRLLFRALTRLPETEVDGLIQSSNRVLAPGLPASAGWFGGLLSADWRLNRLSRVVVSLQVGGKPRLAQRLSSALRQVIKPIAMLVATLMGRLTPLGRFEATRFKDFVWRALFARTLPHEDFDAVTSRDFRVAAVPWSAMHLIALLTRRFGHAVYPRLDTRGYDVMFAETPYPGRVSSPTTMVVRYHDAFPVLMPHTISDTSHHQAAHFHALRRNVLDGAWFACISDATRNDLLAIFPQAESRAVTIHNMVSHHYFPEDSLPDRVPEIIRIRLSQSIRNNRPDMSGLKPRGALDYLLMVSTIEPRKNHLTLLAAWEQLRAEAFPGLKLVLVGMLGWKHKEIVRKFRPWLERGDLYLLEDVPAAELRLLYRHARATVCPSYGEGFDFSGVEAMRCGGVVAASDIAVHREVFADAADYFNPYSAATLAQSVKRLIGADAGPLREAMLGRGAEVSQRYLPERIAPQWEQFLSSLPVREKSHYALQPNN